MPRKGEERYSYKNKELRKKEENARDESSTVCNVALWGKESQIIRRRMNSSQYKEDTNPYIYILL